MKHFVPKKYNALTEFALKMYFLEEIQQTPIIILQNTTPAE